MGKGVTAYPSRRGIAYRDDMVNSILNDWKTMTRRVVTFPVPSDFVYRGRVATVISKKPVSLHQWFDPSPGSSKKHYLKCPYGEVGDLQYIKECWRVGAWNNNQQIAADYRADGAVREEWLTVPDKEMFDRFVLQSRREAERAASDRPGIDPFRWDKGSSPSRWRSPRFMPKFVARTWARITNVYAEPLTMITPEDIEAEGLRVTPDEIGIQIRLSRIRAYEEADETLIMEWREAQAAALRKKWIFLWNSLHPARDRYVSDPWVWVITFERITP